MKIIPTILFSLFFLSFFSTTLQAQTYSTALGLRLGYPASASYKNFIANDRAIEAFVGFRSYRSSRSWINVGVAYQVHNELPGLKGLQWYYGLGVSAYSYQRRANFPGDRDGSVSFGLQGYLGLDYIFPDIPINLSLDWVPTYFLNGNGFDGNFGALAVRYVLR